MSNAAKAHFGLDPGSGKICPMDGWQVYGQHQDTHSTLAAVRGNVSADDYAYMKQILLNGCPAQLDFKEPLSNKIKIMECGN
jgi:hypothetical protein